jgi:transcriptional regulator with XRE-family HTH domain
MTARRQHLAERRRSLGYSQERLAGEVGVDRTTVGRWERGETGPQPLIRERLRTVLEVSAEELDALIPVGPEDEHLPLAAAVAAPGPDLMGELDDMHRREMLRLMSIASVAMALPAEAAAVHSSRMAPLDLDSHAAMNAHLWQVFAMSRSKRQVYPVIRDQLATLTSHLTDPHPDRDWRQLLALTADLYQLAGEVCFDGNRYTDAAHCYTLAATAAREGDAADLWACALTRHAYVSMYDQQHAQASAILAAADTVARNGDRQLATRQWVASVQAQAQASLGDRGGCDRALDTAAGVLDLAASASPGGWLRFDGSRIAEESGSCYLVTGRDAQAEGALTQALGQGISPRRRGSLLTDLAMLGVRRHDTSQVLHYATAAIDLAEQTGSSGYVGRKLATLHTQVQPSRGDRRIALLADRIARLPAT